MTLSLQTLIASNRECKLNKGLTLAVSAFSAAGLLVSGYLTWQALITPVGSCPLALSGFWGCSTVLSSPYARIGGVPTALLGIVWFTGALMLGLVHLRNMRLTTPLLVWSLMGVAGVATLVYIELVVVGAICPFCTAAHVLGIAVLVLAVVMWTKERSNRARTSAVRAAT